MKKCISCKSELSVQARFCLVCGVIQPIDEAINEIASDSTVRNVESTLLSAPPIPPPPPQLPAIPIPPPPPEVGEEEKDEDDDIGPIDPLSELPVHEEHLQPEQVHGDHLQPEKGHGEYLQLQQGHGEPLQPQQVHGEHLQPEQVHGEPLQPQQVHGEHLQPEQVHGEPLQPQQVHGDHVQPQQVHGDHLQTQQVQGTHVQPQQPDSPSQQPQPPQGNYQQLPGSMPQTTATTTKVGTTARKTRRTILNRWIIIAAIVVIVLGASGLGLAFAFHLFTPQPTMSVLSPYNQHGVPVVSDGTTLHVNGQKFATNSAITFILDNRPLNNTPQIQSDGKGNVSADLAVTSAWRLGKHALTAHDASTSKTTSSTEIDVVQQGQGGTPGPNGSPADDASFIIRMFVEATNADGDNISYLYTLTVTGHPDPAGGTVCSSRDTGAVFPGLGLDGLTPFETDTFSCSGTYKGGQISYTEELKSQTFNYAYSTICTLNSPEPQFLQITGSYTDQQIFRGSIIYASIPSTRYTCNNLGIGGYSGSSGVWTGAVGQD